MKKSITKLKAKPLSSIPELRQKNGNQQPFTKKNESQRIFTAYERPNSVTIRVQYPDGPGGNYEGL
jgi:hypothetical protein